MVVDAHQHFIFPSRIHYSWLQGEALKPLMPDYTPEDLRPLLNANRVDQTILVQTRSSLEETREFLQIAQDTDYVAGVVGWIDLSDPEADIVLDDLLHSDNGRYLVGVRHQVHDEPDPNWLLREDVQNGIAELEARDLVYDFLTRSRELPACLQTARNFPNLRFVIDHMAKPNIAGGQWEEWLERITPLAQLPNVWVKLSGIVTEANWPSWTTEDIRPYVHKAVELFGPERCLYGSDWPVCLLAADYAPVKGTLEQVLKLDAPAYERIFGVNAIALYGLSSD